MVRWSDSIVYITIDTSIIRLDMGALHFSVLNNECVTLATVVSKDRGGVEGEIQLFGEFARWVA